MTANREPQLLTAGDAVRQAVLRARQAGKSVGLVPTMGALHEGHLSLLDAARTECDLTVVSIFVNPTQFAPQEDFRSYPRNLERDLALLGGRGCDIVFAPTNDAMYAANHATFVDVGPIGQVLEGAYRPTHFRGVATVVLKLFQLVPADRAYFGRKDYQQTIVVRQMVADLNVPIERARVPDRPRAGWPGDELAQCLFIGRRTRVVPSRSRDRCGLAERLATRRRARRRNHSPTDAARDRPSGRTQSRNTSPSSPTAR